MLQNELIDVLWLYFQACEERFNVSHKQTRSRIEQTFGRWKVRFLCLHSEMRFSPEKVCKIILACAVLHNIAVDFQEPDVGEPQQQAQDMLQDRQVDGGDGRRVRDRIAEMFFM